MSSADPPPASSTRPRRLAALAGLAACALACGAPAPTRDAAPECAAPALALDLRDPGEAARWYVVDDGVMGGLSRGRLAPGPEGLVFAGTLSLENQGGFSSFRSDRELDLSAAGADGALVLRCRGDGRTYRFRLRNTAEFDAPSWQVEFTTRASEWTEHRFRRADFVAMWRGRSVPGTPPLDLARVRSLGVVLADKAAGEFRLELQSLAVEPGR